jgi:O-antigen ligase
LEAKQLVFLAATVIFIPVASRLGCSYRWAERALVAGAFFSTCYLVDINLVSTEWYRGDTRGFEFGLTDWMVISLIIVMARSPRWRNQRLTLLPPNSGPIILYLIIALLSALTAYVTLYAGFGLMKLLRAVAVYWVAYNYLRRPEDLRFVLYILAAIVCMEFLLVLKQRASGIYRAVGSTPHPNTLAMYINMMNMIFLSFFLNDESGRAHRWVYFACIAMGSLIVAATFSRGGLAMMVGGYGLVTLISVARRPSGRKLKIIGLCTLLAIPVALRLAPAIIDRFENAPEESGVSRWQANEAAIAMANDHLLGVGINNYSHLINETAYSRFIPNESDRGIVHNIYLLHACEMGWPGLVAFVLLIGNFLWLGLRSILNRRNDPATWMGTGIFVGMVGFWLQSGLEWAFRQTYLTVEFFMLAGFLAALPRVARAARLARKRRLVAASMLSRALTRPIAG